MRESTYAFPVVISLHSISMGFLAGPYLALDLRLLGAAATLQLTDLRAFRVVTLTSFVVSLASGLLLLASYPAKALTNELFYCKLGLIISAFTCHRLLDRLLPGPGPVPAELTRRLKIYACVSMVLWIGVITAGRLLAYTHDILMTTDYPELP